MSRIIKVLSNELIKIEEYKNPRICFNNNEYDDIENYCVLRETINPFQMYYKCGDLERRIEKAIEYINENWGHWCSNHFVYATEVIKILKGEEM